MPTFYRTNLIIFQVEKSQLLVISLTTSLHKSFLKLLKTEIRLPRLWAWFSARLGYEFVNLGKMMESVKKGADANEALEKAKSHYGQFEGAIKYIDPRQE